MSGPRDREGRDCGTDIAAYALGALEPQETDALRRHLSGCTVCRDELSALQGATDALALAVPQLGPPRGLRRRIMSEVRSEPRQAPPPRGRQASARLRLGPATLAGALAVAAAVVAAVLLAQGGTGSARVIRASVSAAGASAVLNERGGTARLVVKDMPQPPAGKIYEIWIQRGQGAPRPTDALFGVTSRGAATVAVPGSLHGVRAVLVTPEPRGGSSLPTHAPVIVARL